MRNRGWYRDLDTEQKQALKRIVVNPALQSCSISNWLVPCASGVACAEHVLLALDQGALPMKPKHPCSSAYRCSWRSWTSFAFSRIIHQIHIGFVRDLLFWRFHILIGEILYCSCVYLSSDYGIDFLCENRGIAISYQSDLITTFVKAYKYMRRIACISDKK